MECISVSYILELLSTEQLLQNSSENCLYITFSYLNGSNLFPASEMLKLNLQFCLQYISVLKGNKLSYVFGCAVIILYEHLHYFKHISQRMIHKGTTYF